MTPDEIAAWSNSTVQAVKRAERGKDFFWPGDRVHSVDLPGETDLPGTVELVEIRVFVRWDDGSLSACGPGQIEFHLNEKKEDGK